MMIVQGGGRVDREGGSDDVAQLFDSGVKPKYIARLWREHDARAVPPNIALARAFTHPHFHDTISHTLFEAPAHAAGQS